MTNNELLNLAQDVISNKNFQRLESFLASGGDLNSRIVHKIEKAGRYQGQFVGRSPYLQAVQAFAPATMIGAVAPVTITELSANSLFGALATTPAHHSTAMLAEAGG